MAACAPSTFSPSLFGAEVLSLQASLVTNYSASVSSAFRFTQPSVELRNATFCNVTVTYTHPGQNDNIAVEAWLPTADKWNERLLAVGGGGWAAGRFFVSYENMKGAVADGYATFTTDAGLDSSIFPTNWALNSPGNVNMYNLKNLAWVSLNDEAIIGKSLIKSFYGRGPTYSYWNGCSQGGRQGLMLAQRFPTAYDGISAGAPALHWSESFTAALWPQQLMNSLGEYPYGCEIQAITAAAISACDGLDGVLDGIIGEADLCLKQFDPFKVVGTTITCAEKSNSTVQISNTAAKVVNATWHGPVTAEGKKWWYGYNPGANLVDNNGLPGVAATNCTAQDCVGSPNMLALPWLKLFVAAKPDLNFSNLTQREFDDLMHSSNQQYRSILDTDDPDLSEFRKAGGKLVSFHGLTDEFIPTKGSEQYYNAVGKAVPGIEEFYRYYQLPGYEHCFGGSSSPPTSLFSQLRAWVENGTVPGSTLVQITNLNGTTQRRIVCPYPQKTQFNASCGNVSNVDCWLCIRATSLEH
ncbi:Tannase/feruloyl esterase [Truncatella angustata]|uniref:Carboxylic ester hydrolase n=1 Tax=Truncatella angustata TaxID=152316 RepID=A0A9P8UYW9_9PEZI|nr:Tannase/feruloyl esterase [Truncatella angustata]KAH6660913.1 Tannase/feruloyl esterase [Truncatella angustata]